MMSSEVSGAAIARRNRDAVWYDNTTVGLCSVPQAFAHNGRTGRGTTRHLGGGRTPAGLTSLT
jgi:hypothetical protein